MTIDDVLLNANDVSFADIVHQLDIQTQEDKKPLEEQGCILVLTEGEFRAQLPELDPRYVYYAPSMSLSSFYFNPETLAVCPLHLEMLTGKITSDCFTVEKVQRAIQSMEKSVAEGKYMNPLQCLPDRMQLEYFTKLLQKGVSNLYGLFLHYYGTSDYGFRGMDKETVRAILATKPSEPTGFTDEDSFIDYAEVQQSKKVLSRMPDVVTIYRGGNSASADYKEAFSWTTDINVANFFACRRGSHEGYLVEATVKKSDIIELIFSRGESEVLVDPDNVTITQVIPIHGVELLQDVLSKVNPIYQEYRALLPKLRFTIKSEEHNVQHEGRVLLLAQIIAELMELPIKERRLLAEAAIFHDTKRTNDGVDLVHGGLASNYYAKAFGNKANPLVKFLCKYHCLPDEEGYAAIEAMSSLRKQADTAKLLLQVFKDADALDRVRFGLRDIDMQQLRLPVSKELSLVSRLILENVKV